MATYKKKDKTAKQMMKDQRHIAESESTTKEVFEGLDAGANRIETWILKRQKPILIAVGALVAIILGYMAYTHFILAPKEKIAANELAFPKVYFKEAMKATQESDSLFKMALNGDGAKYGFTDIVDQYGSTDAGNLARYFAGVSYYKLGDFKNAIDYLDDFSSDDMMMYATAKGLIGDSFAELKKWDDALDYYKQAVDHQENDLTTPIYLEKASNAAFVSGDKKLALSFLERIKSEFPTATNARDIETKINSLKVIE